jgi:hypothetical protein
MLPGFEPSKTLSKDVEPLRDEFGQEYLPCYYCKNPVKDEKGKYIDDIVEAPGVQYNAESYYEEGFSQSDDITLQQIENIRYENRLFVEKIKEIAESITNDLNGLETVEDIDIYFSYDGLGPRKCRLIDKLFESSDEKIKALADKSYFYKDPSARDPIFRLLNKAKSYHSNTFNIRNNRNPDLSKVHKTLQHVLITAWRKYRDVNRFLDSLQPMIGTKKQMVSKQIVDHPICAQCFQIHGQKCAIEDCQFRSIDEDDFVDISNKRWGSGKIDKFTRKRISKDTSVCKEHGFTCENCSYGFLNNEDEGQPSSFEDELYCSDCFNSSFSYCSSCSTVMHSEDLNFDENSGESFCNKCYEPDNFEREYGVDKELSPEEQQRAAQVVEQIGRSSEFYPLNIKVVETQILPILKAASKKRFKSVEQLSAFINKRIQSKEGKAAVAAEASVIQAEHNQEPNDLLNMLVDFFQDQLTALQRRKEDYPNLKGSQMLPVNVKASRTPGHSGTSFAIYPTEKLLDYADRIMPGAKDAYENILKRKGHHRGALAYVRFSRSNDNIIIDNLQTDLDKQSLSSGTEGKKNMQNKALVWWLNSIKKFWVPYMLQLMNRYGVETDQEVFLTSFEMQESKWSSIPERNKDTYDRIPAAMGFEAEEIYAKPEDLVGDHYTMRRIAEFTNLFIKLC